MFLNVADVTRQFVAVGLEAKKAAFNRHSVRKASLSLNLNRSGTLLEEMGSVS